MDQHQETSFATSSNSSLPEAELKFHQNNEIDDDDKPQLSLGRKIAYGLGGPPMQMVTNCVGFFLVIFLLETAGLTPYYNSVIQFTARAWDAVTDPIVGYLVSRTETRFGKFRPWLLLSAPFGALSFFFLFYVPKFETVGLKFFYYLAMILLLQTSTTTFHVPYSSMTMVLTTNAKERDQCSLFRMFFELSGVLIGVGVFGSLVVAFRPTSSSSSTSTSGEMGYMIGSAVLSILFIICAIIAFFGTKEKPIKIPIQENYFKSLRRILCFKPYLLLMFAFLFISLGMQIIQNNMSMYITHSLDLPDHITYGIMVILATAILFMPILYRIMKVIGKKNTFRLGLLNFIPVLVTVMFVPSKPSLWVFYTVMVWAGLSVSVSYLVPWSMLPNVIDDFMVKTGTRKEAAFYSLFVFFNKFAVGFAAGFSSLIIGAAGYDSENSTVQPESVSIVLRYLIGVSAVICMTCSYVILHFYPLDGDYMVHLNQQVLAFQQVQLKAKSEMSCNTEINAIDSVNVDDSIKAIAYARDSSS